MKLTKREIDGLACPPGKRDAMFMDDEIRGFALRVTETGSKVFLFQYRFAGRVRRLVLGPYGDLTSSQARKLAEEARGKVLAGGDPVGERKAVTLSVKAEIARQAAVAAADALTFGILVGRWQDGPLKERSASYRKDAPARLRTSLGEMLARPVHSITTGELQLRLDAIATSHPVMARRLRDYGRSMCVWAQKRQLIEANPFGDLIVDGGNSSRDRVLTDNELAAYWNASHQFSYPFGPYFRLLALTLQRRDEVADMRWDEISPDCSEWTIPAERTKNGKAHIVHLSEPARDVLRDLSRQVGPKSGATSPYVFTTNGRTPTSGFSKAKKRLEELVTSELQQGQGEQSSPRSQWRLHDLRRTGVTAMARLGVGHHVADRVLNHVQGKIKGVQAVYQRHDFLAERAEALDTWGRHILATARGQAERRQASNVVPLKLYTPIGRQDPPRTT